jgi:hypothetical protein
MAKYLNLNNLRWIPLDAQVEEVNPSTSEGQQFLTAATEALETKFSKAAEASLSPIGDDGKPRMLRISAWIAHAGKPNRNGDAFREEDLRDTVAKGLFKAPALGMIDFNHDFTSYGAWYDAEYKYDPAAEEMGILATGAIFAWRYEDLANTVLAMQARNGFIPVSMAAIPEELERAEDSNGRPYWILVRPVFFTTSVLDVEPADPNARGIGTENPEVSSEALKKTLVEAAKKSFKEEEMDEHKELIDAIRALLDNVADEKITPALSKVAELVEKLPALEQELADATEEVSTLTEANVELQTKLDEATVALEAARDELAELQTEAEELKSFKADAEEKEAERVLTERITARLAELPESVRKALEAKDEETQERLRKHYADMTDEQFDVYLEGLKVVAKDKGESFLDKSRREGALYGGSDPEKRKFQIDRYIK